MRKLRQTTLPADFFLCENSRKPLDSPKAPRQTAIMQTLGLAAESKRSDGRLKSIFWPTVENAWDVNYLGQQGFWICVVIGVLRALVGVFSGSPLFLAVYLAMALVFLVGAMGVREASWLAAAMVFAIFSSDILYTLAVGRLPGIVSILFAGVLLSNLRAAFLASQWRPAREDEDKPTRFNETFWDKLVDQWPAKAWPVLEVPFFAVSALLLLLSLAAVGTAIWQRLGALPGPLHP
jgi:hypothetical protein